MQLQVRFLQRHARLNERTGEQMAPFYEFFCDCGHTAEVFFQMDDEKRIICEGCKKKLMQRKYSLGGTIFKGEGWGGSK